MNRVCKLKRKWIALILSVAIVCMCGCGSTKEIEVWTSGEAEITNTSAILHISPSEEETTTQMEETALQKVMEKYSGQSIQFFSLVCDVGTYATEDGAKQLLADKGVTFPCMIYNDSISDGYMESLTGYPKTLYLNKNGQIMYEVGGAYAGYGEDYAVECHSYYVDWFLANPDYVAK